MRIHSRLSNTTGWEFSQKLLHKTMKFAFFSRFFNKKRSVKKVTPKRLPSESTIDTQDDSYKNSREEESVSDYQQKVKRYATNSPQDTATCLNNLGVALQKISLKKTPKSEAITTNSNRTASAAYHASLKINRKQFGDSHPSIAVTLNNLGSVFYSEGSFHRALKYYNQSLEIMMKHLGSDNENVATIWNNMGDVHRAMQNLDKAKCCFEEALKVRRKHFCRTDLRVVRLLTKINECIYSKELSKLKSDIVNDMSYIGSIESQFKQEIDTLLALNFII